MKINELAKQMMFILIPSALRRLKGTLTRALWFPHLDYFYLPLLAFPLTNFTKGEVIKARFACPANGTLKKE